MAAHGVIIAVSGPVETRVAQAIDTAPGLHVVRRCADLAEAAAAASAGLGSVVVVSDQPHLTRAVLADFAHHGVAVVGVPTTPEAAEQLRIIGIHTTVAPHGANAELPAAVERAIAATERADNGRPPGGFLEEVRSGQGAAPSGSLGVNAASLLSGEGAPDAVKRQGELVAVWGPAGAPGRTTVAVNLAAELASESVRVLLIDADTYGGAVAQACGLTDEAPGLAAVARIAQHGAVGPSDLARHALVLAPGLHVLTGITRAERWGELPRSALEEVWRAAQLWADVTVIDCGFSLEADEELVYDTRAPQRNGATLGALAHATRVVAVGTAEPLGIQRLVHALPALRHASKVDPAVIINRVRSDVAGPRPEEAVADAMLRFAQVPHAWMIPWDPFACDAATLAGQTLKERAPRSKVRRAFASVARGLSLEPDVPVTSRPARVVHAGVGD